MVRVTKKPPKGWGSIEKYAEYANVARQTANKYVIKFDIPKKGKWVEFAAIDKARQLLHDDSGKVIVKKTSNNTARLTKHRADIMATRSESDALKFRELQGELIRRTAIINAAEKVISAVRQEMIALPNNLTPQLAACGEDEKAINEVLTNAVNEVMTSLYELSKI